MESASPKFFLLHLWTHPLTVIHRSSTNPRIEHSLTWQVIPTPSLSNRTLWHSSAAVFQDLFFLQIVRVSWPFSFQPRIPIPTPSVPCPSLGPPTWLNISHFSTLLSLKKSNANNCELQSRRRTPPGGVAPAASPYGGWTLWGLSCLGHLVTMSAHTTFTPAADLAKSRYLCPRSQLSSWENTYRSSMVFGLSPFKETNLPVWSWRVASGAVIGEGAT
jgi:hypothetical protein